MCNTKNLENKLTKSFSSWLDQSELEARADLDLFEHLGHLEVPTADQASFIDLGNVIAHLDLLAQLVDNTALLDALDERVAGAVVRDGQTQRWLVLVYVDLLAIAAHMREYEVVEADLSAK